MPEATPEATPAPLAALEQTPTEVAKSFTQDDVNALLAKQKREQFGDYGDLKAKAAKLVDLEEAQMTEAQKVAERATAAERERDEAKATTLRYDAAITHGIGKDYFDLLGTGTEEAINTRAETLGSLIKAATEVDQLRAEVEALRAGKPAPTNGRPVEALKPGATPTNATNEDDVLYNSLFGG